MVIACFLVNRRVPKFFGRGLVDSVLVAEVRFFVAGQGERTLSAFLPIVKLAFFIVNALLGKSAKNIRF